MAFPSSQLWLHQAASSIRPYHVPRVTGGLTVDTQVSGHTGPLHKADCGWDCLEVLSHWRSVHCTPYRKTESHGTSQSSYFITTGPQYKPRVQVTRHHW